ncbi:MAG: DUF7694 domain-containing protein, partial [Mycobacterium sp.]
FNSGDVMREKPMFTNAGRVITVDKSDDQNAHYLLHVGRDYLSTRVSNGGGWDHVSVTAQKKTRIGFASASRCPTWEQMCLVKDVFFHPTETVMQLHVPEQDNISHHNFCLHLWRPQTDDEIARVKRTWLEDGELWPGEYPDVSAGKIPRPPAHFVGPTGDK